MPVASGLSKLSLASTLVLGVKAVGQLWAPYQDQDVRSIGGSAGCREIDREVLDVQDASLPSRGYGGTMVSDWRCSPLPLHSAKRRLSTSWRLCVPLQRTKEEAVSAPASAVPPLHTRVRVPWRRVTSGPAPRLVQCPEQSWPE